MADLVPVLTTPSLIEARLAFGALEGAGLHPVIADEFVATTLGAGRHVFPCRVLVPDHEASRARAAIEALERDAHAERPDEPEVCPDCGTPWEPGFDLCWHCGPGEPEERDEPVPVVREVGQVQIRVDGVSATLARVPRAFDVAMLGAACCAAAIGMVLGPPAVLGGFALAAVLLVGAALGFGRTVAVTVDVHALTVGQQRVLWEEVERVWIGPYRIRWLRHDGGEDAVAVLTSEADRTALREAIEVQQRRERAPRDARAERAVQSLVERS